MHPLAKSCKSWLWKFASALWRRSRPGALATSAAASAWPTLWPVLYGSVMRYDSQNPQWPDRDKLVCSKGHAGPAVYAALAVKGFFPYEDLKTLNQPGTYLPSHCDKNKTPGVDMTTGSLGQGTSLAVGIALGDRLKGRDSRTYLLVGDGESDEGQVWEAAMFAAAKKVTNLIWLVDDNKKQLDGYTKDILPIFDLEAKFAAFGFDARRVNGNDIAQVYDAITAPLGGQAPGHHSGHREGQGRAGSGRSHGQPLHDRCS